MLGLMQVSVGYTPVGGIGVEKKAEGAEMLIAWWTGTPCLGVPGQ